MASKVTLSQAAFGMDGSEHYNHTQKVASQYQIR